MAYKPKDQFFPALVEGNVRTVGSSLTLGVGELAFVDVSRTTKQGVKVLEDFTNLPADAKLAIRIGEMGGDFGRTGDNKAISTIPFVLSDVKGLRVSAPERNGVLVDDFVIGFNGKDGSEIKVDTATNETIELRIAGNLLGMYGMPNREYTAKVNLTGPIKGDKNTTSNNAPANEWTDHELVENAYLELRKHKIPGGIPITNFLDIMLVNSENPKTIPGTGVKFYSVTVADNGFSTDLGKIQAKYPELEIKATSHESGKSTYTAIAAAKPVNYQAERDFVLKGCKSCPSGYTEIKDGFVYQVTLENDAANETAKVQGLPGAETGSAKLNATDGDVNTYSVVVAKKLTEAQIKAFITANKTAKVTLIAEDVADLCKSAQNNPSIAWVEGKECYISTETYTITLSDNECGDSRLPELKLAFPDLTITEGASKHCQRTYTTKVGTNLVSEECSEIFRDIFESEAPDSFDNVFWEKAPKVYSGTAKMGIRVRGKRASLSGGEFLRDEMPFFDDSVEISISNGYPETVTENNLSNPQNVFAVKYFSRKAPAHNLGGNLRKYEEEAQMHFRGRNRYVGNNYGKMVSGQETRFEGLKSYIVYALDIVTTKGAGSFQQAQNDAYTYHFSVDVGKQGRLEEGLNKLASAAGVPMVRAVAKE